MHTYVHTGMDSLGSLILSMVWLSDHRSSPLVGACDMIAYSERDLGRVWICVHACLCIRRREPERRLQQCQRFNGCVGAGVGYTLTRPIRSPALLAYYHECPFVSYYDYSILIQYTHIQHLRYRRARTCEPPFMNLLNSAPLPEDCSNVEVYCSEMQIYP